MIFYNNKGDCLNTDGADFSVKAKLGCGGGNITVTNSRGTTVKADIFLDTNVVFDICENEPKLKRYYLDKIYSKIFYALKARELALDISEIASKISDEATKKYYSGYEKVMADCARRERGADG